MTEGPLTCPELWNQLHRDYDKTIVPLFSTVAARALEMVCPARDSDVLDVACGPGTLTLLAAPRVRSVTAVDFASSMVDLLQAKCTRAGIANVNASVANGMALPFADAAFDAAFSNFGLFLFSDRGKGLCELFRVVKTQSKVGISSWSPAIGPIEAMYRVVREVLPDLPFQKGGAPLGSKEDIVKEMSAAGFESVSVEPASVTFSFPSVEAFWEENSRASGPLVATRQRVAANEWPGIESRILDALSTAFPREVRYDREALIGVARKPARPA